jgi:hypothetical protein
VLLEARPVYMYLRSQTFGTPADPTEMLVGFSLALLLCLVATFAPLEVAKRKLEQLEI